MQKKSALMNSSEKGTGRKSGYGLSFQFCPVLESLCQQKKVFLKIVCHCQHYCPHLIKPSGLAKSHDRHH